MKIYLDKCILSRMVDGKWGKPEDSVAFDYIQRLYPSSFFVSQLTFQEINNIRVVDEKNKNLALYNSMNQVALPAVLSYGGLVSLGGRSSTQDLDRRELLNPEPEEDINSRGNYIPNFQNKREK